MIGADFPKIEFQLFGLELVEPMAIITDTLLGGLSLFFAYKMSKRVTSNLPFYRYWRQFFLVFGIGAFLGGVGHTFYNQFDIIGKIPSWLCGPISIFFVEKAMISVHWNKKLAKQLNQISLIKLSTVYLIFFYLLFFGDKSVVPNLPFLPIAINTIVGISAAAGILGFKYTERISVKFKYFWLGVLIMLPTAFIFLMKINLHQWFDKNDFSHILLMLGITYFYLGIFTLSKGLKQSTI